MQAKKYTSEKKEKNAIKSLLFQYLPYWPLFALLLVLGYLGARAYLYVTKPKYEISASILIKDEKKGADAESISDVINGYGLSKIVENEIEVVKSKDLLRKVVDSLCLYAPVFEDGPIVQTSAYTSSPVAIEISNSKNMKEVSRVNFKYNAKTQNVII